MDIIMQNKSRKKRIIFFVVSIIILLFYLLYTRYGSFYENDYKIVKIQKIDKRYSFVYIDEAGETGNIYILDNDNVSNFKRNRNIKPILCVKRISWDNINLRKIDQNVYGIYISKSAYMYGKIYHFQNYFYKDYLKELKILLKIKE